MALATPEIISMIPHSFPCIDIEDQSAVLSALQNKTLASGALVENLEKNCADYLGFSYGRTTVSGQSALVLALHALGIHNGDEVIIPTYVCRSVAQAVESVGAIPVFCDIGENWCLNLKTVNAVKSDKTAAIIAVHVFGIRAPISPLKKLGLPIIEDCCQLYSPDVGHEGDISVYSFHATKCLTTGEGGFVATSRGDISQQIENSIMSGFVSSRLSDLQAALGISQLSRYDTFLKRRKEIADMYFESLPQTVTSNIKKYSQDSIFFRFPILSDKDYVSVSRAFFENGIHVRHGVDMLLHRESGLDDICYPNASKFFAHTISIPLYPALTKKQVEHIAKVTTKILA